VFEGEGQFNEYAGGYDDWERYQRQLPEAPIPPPRRPIATPRTDPTAKRVDGPRKPTYKEQRELETLPGRIESLEKEQRELHVRMGEGDFYRQPNATITAAMDRLESLKLELEAIYQRWQELESLSRG